MSALKVHLICRQVGTAYHLIEFGSVLDDKGFNCIYYAYSDCSEILNKEGIAFHLIENFEDYQNKIDSVPEFIFTGTSALGKDDQKFWIWGKDKKIKTIAWLDQNIGLDVRFPNKHASNLPDIVLSPNQSIISHPQIIDFDTKFKTLGSPYFEKLKLKTNHRESIENIAIFATEPTPDWYKTEHGIDDETSFRHGIDCLNELAIEEATKWKIFIKLHPRDQEKRWKRIQESISHMSNLEVALSDIEKEEAFQKAKIVFGMRSMFLYEASLLGIPTISFQIDRKTSSELIDFQSNIFTWTSNTKPNLKEIKKFIKENNKPGSLFFNQSDFLEIFLT
jgi:hypothetical protein